MEVEVWDVKGFKTEIKAKRYAHRVGGRVVLSNDDKYKWMASERGIDAKEFPYMAVTRIS